MKKIDALRSAAFATAGLLAASSALADYTVSPDPATARQTMEGWGTTLSWFANDVGGWKSANLATVADQLFDPNKGLGLNYLRYNIAGGDNPGVKSLGYPAIHWPHNVPGYQPASGVYDWTADANQRAVLAAAIARGANLFEAQSNSPPWWMTITRTAQGNAHKADNLAGAFYGSGRGTFADYLATVVGHFHDYWGVTFRNLDPCNEPRGDWHPKAKQEGCCFSVRSQDAIVKDTGRALLGKGLLTKVCAMDEFGVAVCETDLQGYSREALGYMTQINTHTYRAEGRETLEATAAADGKRMVMSEWGCQDRGAALARRISNQILDDVEMLQCVDWVIWQPNSPYLMNRDEAAQTTTLAEGYYAFGNFTKFIRPGYQIINPVDGDQTLEAYDPRSGNLILVTSNWGDHSARVTYNLSGFSGVGRSVSVYRTSGSEKLAQVEPALISNGGFSYTLPAGSVSTFVVPDAVYAPTVTTVNDGTVGTGMNQFDYSGSWGANAGDHPCSQVADDAYTLKFSGPQARVYAAFAPGNGMAAFSVDGGAETWVDTYAAARADDRLVYATPTLPTGTHTLKCRVTGLKSPWSTGTAIEADHVDIVAAFASVKDEDFTYSGSWSSGSRPATPGGGHHWSGNGGDYYTCSFTGSQARVYAALAPDQGMAAFTVDGGAETDVDLYSSTPVDGTFEYATPVFARGTQHTIKVRVTGTRNPMSTGSVVTADRIDVVP